MKLGLVLLGMGMLVGCAPMGPDYRRPELVTDARYKEDATWRFAVPADAVPRGAWWRVFRDAGLNQLEELAGSGNPGLRAALLRVDQARVAARGAAVEFLPEANARVSADRRGDSGNLRRSRGDVAFFGRRGISSGFRWRPHGSWISGVGSGERWKRRKPMPGPRKHSRRPRG